MFTLCETNTILLIFSLFSVKNNKKKPYFVIFLITYGLFYYSFCNFIGDFRGSYVNVYSWTCPALHNKRPSTPSQVRQCCHNKAGIGWEFARVATFCRKAFTQRFIATIQTSNTWNPRSRCCNGRCPRDVYIRIPF